jgi:hypothetical protein
MQISHVEGSEVITNTVIKKGGGGRGETFKDSVLDKYYVHHFFITFYENRTN